MESLKGQARVRNSRDRIREDELDKLPEAQRLRMVDAKVHPRNED